MRWYYIYRREFDGWKWIGWLYATAARVTQLRARAAPHLFIGEH